MALASVLLTLAQGAKAEQTDTGVSAPAHVETIDLGLSVLWASCNLGAESPERYGDYYAWGEVAPRGYYAWQTYKYANNSTFKLTKYCTYKNYGDNGFTDNKTVLEPEDDAAMVNWGEEWRMPTHADWTELREQCTWIWTTQNDVNGYRVTSKINRNSIFLPAAGYRGGEYLRDDGSIGYYWSSSLYDNSQRAWYVYFRSDLVIGSDRDRTSGHSIRPVRADKTGTGITTPQQDDASATGVRKVLRNGQVLIERNGKTYTLTGVEMK